MLPLLVPIVSMSAFQYTISSNTISVRKLEILVTELVSGKTMALRQVTPFVYQANAATSIQVSENNTSETIIPLFQATLEELLAMHGLRAWRNCVELIIAKDILISVTSFSIDISSLTVKLVGYYYTDKVQITVQYDTRQVRVELIGKVYTQNSFLFKTIGKQRTLFHECKQIFGIDNWNDVSIIAQGNL